MSNAADKKGDTSLESAAEVATLKLFAANLGLEALEKSTFHPRGQQSIRKTQRVF